MATVVEGAPANATSVAAKGQVVVGVSPAERLRRDQGSSLLEFAVVTLLAVLAPARLVLALLTVLTAVGGFVLHLVDIVIATSV